VPDRAEAAESFGEVQLVPITAITASPRNPRRKLRGIEELAASLQTHGLLQPVVVRPTDDHFELVAGHRRLAAARHLAWQTIPAVVRQAAAEEAYLLTLVENLQREDLSPREEAAALEVLVREHGWSTRQVAAAIQRSQAFVSKRLRVFEDPMLAPVVLAGGLTVSAAEEVLTVPERYRYDLLARAVEGGWDLAQVRTAVKQQRFGPNQTRQLRRPGLPRRLRELRMELRDVRPEDLGLADRRELRLLFTELAMLARANPQPGQRRIFPPLPRVRSS
jgi:ParB family chromosome partitioning protein